MKTGRRKRWWVWSFTALIFANWGWKATPGFGAEVAVFISGELEAYQSAMGEIRKEITGAALTEFNMLDSVETGKKMAQEIKGSNPDVVLALGAKAAKLAKEELPDIPLVYCLVFNPFELGLVGSSVSGVAMIASPDDQFRNFKIMVPGLLNLGVIFDPEKSRELLEVARKAASRQGISLQERSVTSSSEVAAALKEIISTIDALWLLPDTTVVSKESFAYFLNASLEKRKPIFAFSEGLVKSGALLSVSPDYPENGKRAGEQVNRILSGGERAALVYPEGKLSINSKTAEALGIRIPEGARKKAENIY